MLLSIGQLLAFLATAGAAVGSLVLGIMAWRFTGKLDDAYDDGYDDGIRAGDRPAARHAVTSGPVPGSGDGTVIIPCQLPPDLSAPLLAADEQVEAWIANMHRWTDEWVKKLVADANR